MKRDNLIQPFSYSFVYVIQKNFFEHSERLPKLEKVFFTFVELKI